MYIYTKPLPKHKTKSHLTQKTVHPIQRYTTFLENNKIYNESVTGRAICGLEYPNHEFYTVEGADISKLTTDASALIEFEKVGVPRNFRNSRFPNDRFDRIVPQYKMPSPPDNEKSVKYITSELKLPSELQSPFQYSFLTLSLSTLKTAKENLRKYITQWAYKYGDINSNISLCQEYYSYIYIELTDYIENSKACKDNIFTHISLLEDRFSYSPFDDNALMMPKISENLDIIKYHLKRLPDVIDHNDFLRSYLFEQEHNNDLMLPRGCDLIAGLFGETSGDKIIKAQFSRKDTTSGNDHVHFTTKIFSDFADYITIEGFAKKDFTFLDNTWEFFMHGNHIPSSNDAFKKYTQIRYSYFEDFNKGVPKLETDNPKQGNTMYARGLVDMVNAQEAVPNT